MESVQVLARRRKKKKKRQGGLNKMACCIPYYGITRLTYCLDLNILIRSRNNSGYDTLPVCAPTPPKQRHLVRPDSV